MPVSDDDLVAALAAGLGEGAPTALDLESVRRSGARRRRRRTLLVAGAPVLSVLALAVVTAALLGHRSPTTLAAGPQPSTPPPVASQSPTPPFAAFSLTAPPSTAASSASSASSAPSPADVPHSISPTPVASGPQAGQPAPAALVARTEDPARLVGSWRVLAADGAEPGAVLVFDGSGEVSLLQSCGALSGGYDADGEGLFDVTINGAPSAACGGPHHVYLTPEWLGRAVGFHAEGAGIRLLDVTGGQVADLEPGAQPSTGPAYLRTPPTPAAKLPASYAVPAPLPAGVTAPSLTDVVGTWNTSASVSAELGITFFPGGGAFIAQDCDPSTPGSWRLAAGGDWISEGSGISGAVACSFPNGPPPVAPDIGLARRVGLKDGALVFYDAKGAVVTTLVRTASLQQKLLQAALSAARLGDARILSADAVRTTRNGSLSAQGEPTVAKGNQGQLWFVQIVYCHCSDGGDSPATTVTLADGTYAPLEVGRSQESIDLGPIGIVLALK